MTTVVHLVRHAAHDLTAEVLVGRTVDVGLNGAGARAAHGLADRLASQIVARVISSPRRRCLETAAPIARRLHLPLEVALPFDEHDAGAWSGQSFAGLAEDPQWQLWNARRGTACPPGGESMSALQDRVVSHLHRLASLHPDETIVVVSHAEPIRAALMEARGIPLDDFASVDIPVASITTLIIGSDVVRNEDAESMLLLGAV